MFRIPKWSIVAFVFLAVATAFVMNHFFGVGAGASHHGDFASQMLKTSAFDTAETSPEETVAQLSQEIPQKLQNLAGPSSPEASHCQCTVEGQGGSNFEFETESQCGPHRMTYEAAMAKMPAVFKEERAKSDADFPRACVTYIMNKFLGKSGEKKSAPFFATCKTVKGQPVKSGYRPCVTQTYVNDVYNSFSDMTSCIGMPQRDYLPKLYNESGFHVNAIGSHYDAGISQMTGDAIDFANTRFKDFQSEVVGSDTESCRRIAPFVKKFAPVAKGREHRCELLAPPDNPMLNLFYMGIKYRQDAELLETELAKANIVQRMEKLGLPPDKYDHEQLVQMLVILGFNSGISGAVSNLSTYLGRMAMVHRQLTLDDFNFSKESNIYRLVNPSSDALTRKPGETNDKWKSRLNEFEREMKIGKEKNPRYQPKIEKISLKSGGETYSTYKIDINPPQLSFPAYLQLYQGSGTRGYASLVSRSADELDTVFKEGTCVPNSYLAL